MVSVASLYDLRLLGVAQDSRPAACRPNDGVPDPQTQDQLTDNPLMPNERRQLVAGYLPVAKNGILPEIKTPPAMQPQISTTEHLHDAFAQIISTHEDFVVDFDEAWQWIGYSTKQKALEMLERNFDDGDDYLTVGLRNTGKKGQPAIQVMLTVDCFKAFAMLAQTEQGKQVRRYYIQLEKQLALAGSLGVAYQTGTPLEQRRELVAQLKTEKEQAKQLLGELLSQETYADYIRVTDRISKIEKQLKSLDKLAVNQLNLLAEQPTLALS